LPERGFRESEAAGTPFLIGPHTFNFHAVVEAAVRAGAAQCCTTVDAAMYAAAGLLTNAPARAAMAGAGREFAARNRGATARTLDLLAAMIRDR
jgi:3-deoxy-D-manno-octulosonic-acid transferase